MNNDKNISYKPSGNSYFLTMKRECSPGEDKQDIVYIYKNAQDTIKYGNLDVPRLSAIGKSPDSSIADAVMSDSHMGFSPPPEYVETRWKYENNTATIYDEEMFSKNLIKHEGCFVDPFNIDRGVSLEDERKLISNNILSKEEMKELDKASLIVEINETISNSDQFDVEELLERQLKEYNEEKKNFIAKKYPKIKCFLKEVGDICDSVSDIVDGVKTIIGLFR